MTPADTDLVFGRGPLRMSTGEHVEVYREAAGPGERCRFTKRFLATEAGDFRPWTGRERRILERLGRHRDAPVARLAPAGRQEPDDAGSLHTWDAGPTVEQWATRVVLRREGRLIGSVFEDCAGWWALARQCLLALDNLHRLGFIHLDFKADNLCIPWTQPGDPERPVAGQPLRPRFDRLALIDVAFSVLPGIELPAALPLDRDPDYQYQSPRLVLALQEGRSGNLAPVGQLDWRCDFFALGAMLWLYLPEIERAHRHGWTAYRHDQATTLVRLLVGAEAGPMPEQPPHADLVAMAETRLREPELAAALEAGTTFDSERAMPAGAEPTPRTHFAQSRAVPSPAGAAAERPPAPAPAVARPVEPGAAAGRIEPTLASPHPAGPPTPPPRVIEPALRPQDPTTPAAAPPMAAPAPAMARTSGPRDPSSAPPILAAPAGVPPLRPDSTASPVPPLRRSPPQTRQRERGPAPAAARPAGAWLIAALAIVGVGAAAAWWALRGGAWMPFEAGSGRAGPAASAGAAPSAVVAAAPRADPTVPPDDPRGTRHDATVTPPGATPGASSAGTSPSVPDGAAPSVAGSATPASQSAPAGSRLPSLSASAVSPLPSLTASAVSPPPSPSAAAVSPSPSASAPTVTAEASADTDTDTDTDPLPAGELTAIADQLMRRRIPRLAETAARQLAPVLAAAAQARELRQAPAVRAAARNVRFGKERPVLKVTVHSRQARTLNEAARVAYFRRDNVYEAVKLQTRAFGANPVDTEVVGNLAFYSLRERPPQAEAARELALHALTLKDRRFPSGRVEDWTTFAIASALTGRDADARNAWFVTMTLSSDLQRHCQAAVRAQTLYGERLRPSVQAMLQRARSSAGYGSCAAALARR